MTGDEGKGGTEWASSRGRVALPEMTAQKRWKNQARISQFPRGPAKFPMGAVDQSCATKEAAGETITPPGVPLPLDGHAAFVTDDCIRVEG